MNQYNFYMAPLEGVTTYTYRKLHHKYFKPLDAYYIPFIVPHEKKGFSHRELMDICPENNEGIPVIPQILAESVDGFLSTAKKIEPYGYKEVNLNLGCPSKTVVSKGRGSAMLTDPEALDQFLDGIFEKCTMEISIKTRIGRFGADEFPELLRIFNQYPVKELIIHPRVQTDYYKNKPNLDTFAYAMKESKLPLCYNGDIVDAASFEKTKSHFPQNDTFMLGRGLIANPFLAEQLDQLNNDANKTNSDNKAVNKETLNNVSSDVIFSSTERKTLHDFMVELCDTYYHIYENDRSTLFKMKEIWAQMAIHFPEEKKNIKQLMKATTLPKYNSIVENILCS